MSPAVFSYIVEPVATLDRNCSHGEMVIACSLALQRCRELINTQKPSQLERELVRQLADMKRNPARYIDDEDAKSSVQMALALGVALLLGIAISYAGLK